MDKEALSDIYWKEVDEKEALRKKEEAEKLKLSGVEAPPVERELTQLEKDLKNDSRKFSTTVNIASGQSRDLMGLWEVIVEGTGNVLTGRSDQNQFQQVSY